MSMKYNWHRLGIIIFEIKVTVVKCSFGAGRVARIIQANTRHIFNIEKEDQQNVLLQS